MKVARVTQQQLLFSRASDKELLLIRTRKGQDKIQPNNSRENGIRSSHSLGRVSLLSELAGRGERLINMHIESGWLTAAPLVLSWGLSSRGGKGDVTLSLGLCEKYKVTNFFSFRS